MISNNDILRRLRYTFDLGDDQMMNLFEQAEFKVTRSQVSDWLKRDSDPEIKELSDQYLAAFLNGFINDRRGKKEGPQPIPERKLNNNLILRKLKIALAMRDEDMISVFKLAGVDISKNELSAFFRNPNHAKYKICQDQYLRNFLKGLQLKFRGEAE